MWQTAEEQIQTVGTSSDDEEHFVVTRPEEEELDPEAEADFDRELAKMMSESVEVRRSERRPMLDIAMPIRRAPQPNGVSQDSSEALPNPAPETVKFSLLSKRGNRPQVSEIATSGRVPRLTR